MKIHQLSVFLENQPGALRAPIDALAAAGVNLGTLALADTERYGILRLVVRDWPRAKAVLEGAGCVVNVIELVAVDVADRPGALAEVLAVVDAAGVNIEYLYGFPRHDTDRAALLLRFDDPDRGAAALAAAGLARLELEALAV